MLRYKTETRPGLVALYNIRPGNGAGQFLQPWSPHGTSLQEILGDKKPKKKILIFDENKKISDNAVTRTASKCTVYAVDFIMVTILKAE